jgi:hypothetical protein
MFFIETYSNLLDIHRKQLIFKNSIVWVIFYHNLQNIVKLFFNVDMLWAKKHT